MIEQRNADLLREIGVGVRLEREGIVHDGINLQFEGERHRLALRELTGRSIVIYGQTEIVKDLIAARVESRLPLFFEAGDVVVHDLATDRPRVSFVHDEGRGSSSARSSRDATASTASAAGPSPRECSAASSATTPSVGSGSSPRSSPRWTSSSTAHPDRGFALLSLRSPQLSRYYIQVAHDEDVARWADDRIWEELQLRTGLDGWTLREGPVLEKGVTGMRSFVVEPMQHGRLYLAGDAAHIVPPTGAKGLNLAMADVQVLAEAIVHRVRTGSDALLEGYSRECLRRVWRAEHFSWWMTSMLHRPPGDDPFDLRLRLSQLRYVTTSEAAARSLAENYVGLETV